MKKEVLFVGLFLMVFIVGNASANLSGSIKYTSGLEALYNQTKLLFFFSNESYLRILRQKEI